MGKTFENMDDRFKNIESELNYKYDSKLWDNAQGVINDAMLDSAFIKATSVSTTPIDIDFNSLGNAFMDEAFTEASKKVDLTYNASFFNDFKDNETNITLDNSLTEAAIATSAIYKTEFWKDADLALKNEGLHHEYKPSYWKEAEKLLNKKERKGFFIKWSFAASLLLLISFAGYQYSNNTNHLNNNIANIKVNTIIKSNSILLFSKKKNKRTTLRNNNTNINNTITNSNNNLVSQVNINSTITKSTAHNNNNNNNNRNSNGNGNGNGNGNVIDYSITNLNVAKANQINNSNSTFNDIPKLERTLNFKLPINYSIVDKPFRIIEPTVLPIITHILALKIEKGLGNNFNLAQDILSARNSFYADYRVSSNRKLKNFQIGIDLGIYHMNLANYEYESKYSVHHLEGSVDNYWYKMTYKDLVYLSSNINVFYNIKQKHKLKLSLGADRLLTSKINVSYQTPIDENRNDLGNKWGLSKGINFYDSSLGLGYEFKLSSKFSFLADTKIGLFDKTNNAYLNNTKQNRDFSFQLGLKYNIFTNHNDKN